MPKPTNNAELKSALLWLWNDLPQEFTDKAILSFERDFDRVLLQLADTLNNRFSSWHSLLKRLKCWRKSCSKFGSLLS